MNISMFVQQMLSIVQVVFLEIDDFLLTLKTKTNFILKKNIHFLHHYKILFLIVNLVYNNVLKHNFVLQPQLNTKPKL